MKKIIGILAFAAIAMALFFNKNTTNNSSGDLDLASLISIHTANAEPPTGAQLGDEIPTGCVYQKFTGIIFIKDDHGHIIDTIYQYTETQGEKIICVGSMFSCSNTNCA